MKAMQLQGQPPYCTNSYMLFSDAGHAIVIDPAADMNLYEDALKEQHCTLSMILLTHGHFDHTTNLDQLKISTGAKLYAAKEDVKGSRLFPVREADEYLQDEQEIVLDEIKLKCWHTPGHSKGCFVFSTEDLLFTGDTLFQGSIGRTDLEGGNYGQIIESLKRIAALPVPADSTVLPGHGDLSRLDFEKQYNEYLQFGRFPDFE